jgi:hypothetical protein
MVVANATQANPKYMIDFNTYRQMHPDKVPPASRTTDVEQHSIDMNSDEPPGGPFCMLLPPTILGYGFHDKKWSMSPSRIYNIDVPSTNKRGFKEACLWSTFAQYRGTRRLSIV